MKDYNFTVNMNVDVPFYPSERHKKLRHLWRKEDFTVKIPNLDEKDFPVALRVKDTERLVPDLGMSVDEFNEKFKNDSWTSNKRSDFIKSKEVTDYFTKDIRFYNGNLYAAKRIEFSPHSFLTEVHHDASPVAKDIMSRGNYEFIHYNNDNSEYDESKSIIDDKGYINNKTEIEERIKSFSDSYVMFNGELWEKCGEPTYNICTSGWFQYDDKRDYAFVEIKYLFDKEIKENSLEKYKENPNWISILHFSARHKEEALERFSGMDKYWNKYRNEEEHNRNCNIEILMPEVLKFKDKIDLEKMHQNSLSVKEVLKDIESFKAPEFDKPEEAYKFFTELVTTYYKGQHGNKDIRIAANSVLKTLSENNSNLVCKYFADKGINTAPQFDKYWKELENGILNKDKGISREKKAEEPEIGR